MQFTLQRNARRANKLIYSTFFMKNAAGTLNIAVEKDEIVLAALNLSLGKVTNLNNDANLKKLCKYVLEKAA